MIHARGARGGCFQLLVGELLLKRLERRISVMPLEARMDQGELLGAGTARFHFRDRPRESGSV